MLSLVVQEGVSRRLRTMLSPIRDWKIEEHSRLALGH